MKLTTTTLLATGLAPIAVAHTLEGEASLTEQLGHQLLSTHHLPLLLAAAAGAVFLLARFRGRR